MFDSIGHGHRDEEAPTRSLLALLIVGVVFTSCWSSVVLVTALSHSASLPLDDVASIDDDVLVPLTMDDARPTLTAPEPPPPPPAAAAAPTVPDDPIEPEPEPETPDDMVEDVKPLDDPPRDQVRSQATTPGEQHGVEWGQEGGTAEGMQMGELGGTGTRLGTGETGPTRVPGSEVRVRRRVEPRYPEAARSLGLGDVTCRVKVTVDARGVPSQVDVSHCPRVFHTSAREALFAWRFYPARRGGRKVAATFSLGIRYRLRG